MFTMTRVSDIDAGQDKAVCKVLIVDDSKADRMICQSFLSEDHDNDEPVRYEFFEAEKGAESIALCEEIEPDCVILDYMMPDMSGLDVLKAMEHRSKEMCIVVLTGQGSEQIAVDIMKSGAQDYISKRTLTADSLQRSVKGALGRVAMMRKIEEQNLALKVAKENAEILGAEARKANTVKSEFLAMMSHEIRTPMNGIIGLTDMLSRTPMSDQQKVYLESIKTSGDALLSIINDILDFSKIEANLLELENTCVQLDTLLVSIVQLFSDRTNEKDLELGLKWGDDVPLFVRSDPFRLRQVIINLVNNAIKFTDEGSILIDVSVSEQLGGYNEEERIVLRFTIRDTGVGIPQEKCDGIFEQFTQADVSTTREYGGTGLGLTISKNIVELMGGRIGVNSVLGKGSVFWFEVPFTLPDDQAAEANLNACFDGKNILVIDDVGLQVEIFCEYFTAVGANAHGAIMVEDALQVLKIAHEEGRSYDLVLTDYKMPFMNGQDFVREVRDRPDCYGTPYFVMMSGLGRKDDDGAQQDADVFLLKPVTPEKLYKKVARLFSEGLVASGDIQGDADEISVSLPSFYAKILVAEDDRTNRFMIEGLLQEVTCACDFAHNGQEAIEILEERHGDYDAVFMDCMMPVMDGYSAMRHVRAQEWGEGVKIISLTANALMGDKEKCLEAGADDYLSKPVKLSNIIEILYKHLPHKKA